MFERIPLPYPKNGLEPYIDAQTVETHYEKHHKTYTDKFNDLVQKTPSLSGKSARDILMNLDTAPADIRTALRNNGGGYYNHNLYFESLCSGGKKPSSAKLETMVKDRFGGFEPMLQAIHEAATAKLFGSGYAWLIARDGKLEVTISSNQDSPLQDGNPNLLLPVDMWEHAYYLKYKNAKADYVTALFHVIDWSVVERRLEEAR